MTDENVRWYTEVERRLRALETGQRAVQTALRGGLIRFQPTDPDIDHPSINVGAGQGDDAGIAMFDSAGDQYFGVGSFNGAGILVVYAGQIAFVAPAGDVSTVSIVDGVTFSPLIPCAWQKDSLAVVDAAARPTTSSASYVTLWRTYLPCMSGGLRTWVKAVPGAGNTMSVRITAEVIGGSAVDVVEQTGMTTATDIDSQWAIPDSVLSPAADPIGRLLILKIEALRSAGASAVAVAPQLPALNWVI